MLFKSKFVQSRLPDFRPNTQQTNDWRTMLVECICPNLLEAIKVIRAFNYLVLDTYH